MNIRIQTTISLSVHDIIEAFQVSDGLYDLIHSDFETLLNPEMGEVSGNIITFTDLDTLEEIMAKHLSLEKSEITEKLSEMLGPLDDGRTLVNFF